MEEKNMQECIDFQMQVKKKIPEVMEFVTKKMVEEKVINAVSAECVKKSADNSKAFVFDKTCNVKICGNGAGHEFKNKKRRHKIGNHRSFKRKSKPEERAEKKIERIVVNNHAIDVEGVFYVKDTNSFNGFSSNLEIDNGYIKVDNNMHTNIAGIFACGDIVNRNIKQVISACGDGASAALEAIKYVHKNK